MAFFSRAKLRSDHPAPDSAAEAAGFARYLQASGLLDGPGLQRALSAHSTTRQPIDMILLELGLMPEARLADAMAGFLGLERIATDRLPSELPQSDRLPLEFLRVHGLLPVAIDGAGLRVATARPFESEALAALGYFMGMKPVALVAVASELKQHLARLLSSVAGGVADGNSEDSAGFTVQDDDIERLRDIAREAPVVRLLNRLVVQAVERKASDIHIEPLEDQVRIRVRMDGALHVVESLPKQLQAGLISRVKILAKLNIAEQRLPQDGRIRIPVHGRDVELRVSTAPALHGESIALRILDRQELPLDLASLGFGEAAAVAIKGMIAQPNGIVLITGPTGSGKTTTLYAALKMLNRADAKLFTVEDPVEYHLAGVNQIHVRPQIGLDFANVLRSILRQDPDIIMIGEIRDVETARIAVQASLTGHLVLSTLHTNSAAGAVTRLIDMGLEDYLLASCLRGVVAQRLVRKLCTACRKPLAGVPEALRRFNYDFGAAAFCEPQGCAACHGTGYRGRTVIHEVLQVTPAIAAAMTRRAPEPELEKLGRSSGMTGLLHNGLSKAACGETSIDEVLRIVAMANG